MVQNLCEKQREAQMMDERGWQIELKADHDEEVVVRIAEACHRQTHCFQDGCNSVHTCHNTMLKFNGNSSKWVEKLFCDMDKEVTTQQLGSNEVGYTNSREIMN